MNKELQFAYRVKRALDANLENLPETTTQSLAEARRVAIARKKQATRLRAVAPQFVLAGAAGGSFHASPPSLAWLSRLSVAIPLLVGVLLLTGMYQHEHHQRISDLAEIDAGVLSDELPLSAYLDHGFNAYLAQQGE